MDDHGPVAIHRRRLEDADVEPDRAPGLASGLHLEVLDRFAKLHVPHDVATLVAEAVAEAVPAVEHLAAGPPEHLLLTPAQDPLGGPVPHRDAPVRADGKGAVSRPGQSLLESLSRDSAWTHPRPL